MMKRVLAVAVALVFGLIADSNIARADNYYRINMRAYRKWLHYQLPHPFADRFWSVVDSQIQNGTIDQIVKSILAKNSLDSGTANTSLIAQRSVVQDSNLQAADQKVREMCKKLNIAYVEIPQAPQGNSQTGTNPNASRLDPNFFSPAPVPAGFTPPTGVPSKN